jgi:ABC-type polysaccharide/polyol phosphate export permease
MNLILEVFDSLKLWRVWLSYSIQDIKNKYSRSVIGPFWITLSMAVTVFAMGPLYGILFSQTQTEYVLYLATGIIFWSFISSVISDATMVFISNESFIKQTKFPKIIYFLRMISRNILMLAHNILIPILIAIFYGRFTFEILYLIPAFILIVLFLFSISITIAILCTRYRDLIPFVNNLIQLAMFMTPVFWLHPNSSRSLYLSLNPFYYLLDSLRSPFYGEVNFYNLGVILLMLVVSLTISLYFYNKYSRRLVYWL